MQTTIEKQRNSFEFDRITQKYIENAYQKCANYRKIQKHIENQYKLFRKLQKNIEIQSNSTEYLRNR